MHAVLYPSRWQGGWGDDEADGGPLNKFYDAELYTAYSPATRKNLARLDENRIDYDLLDDLVCHLAAGNEEGAILVFLPGLQTPLSPGIISEE